MLKLWDFETGKEERAITGVNPRERARESERESEGERAGEG